MLKKRGLFLGKLRWHEGKRSAGHSKWRLMVAKSGAGGIWTKLDGAEARTATRHALQTRERHIHRQVNSEGGLEGDRLGFRLKRVRGRFGGLGGVG